MATAPQLGEVRLLSQPAKLWRGRRVRKVYRGQSVEVVGCTSDGKALCVKVLGDRWPKRWYGVDLIGRRHLPPT